MNEKGLVVLEQYELDVRNARRGRGSFLVDTDRGLKLLRLWGSCGKKAWSGWIFQCGIRRAAFW